MEIKQVLETCIQVLDILTEKKKEADTILDQAKVVLNNALSKEQSIKAREESCKSRELALAGISNVYEEREILNNARIILEKERADFSNFIVEERQKLQKEEEKLYPVRAMAEEVRQDKVALEKEKVEYKDRLKKEFMDGLKAGKFG